MEKRTPKATKSKKMQNVENTSSFENHYMELLHLDKVALVENVSSFECPICFVSLQPYEGVVLRECLHSFCKQCLVSTIQYSEDAAIRCPYVDAMYTCESNIQQREIKALVSEKMYNALLNKSIDQAESAMKNTFHCLTPNCRGWCIYENNLTLFICPLCKQNNCITCKAFHDGVTCEQYQLSKTAEKHNPQCELSEAMLQMMINSRSAFRCPTCQAVITKDVGCDGITCTICKTILCWATRGHRWGPAGKGDTSGGCRCGVNGKKCHTSCHNCH